MTVTVTDQQTQFVLQTLRSTAEEVARIEGITYSEALERVMSALCSN
jgi:hypothetical protein|tara:strand:- start:1140 stop:1280 length:141 start_codon:yes stop_codon:yes gene_type:complete